MRTKCRNVNIIKLSRNYLELAIKFWAHIIFMLINYYEGMLISVIITATVPNDFIKIAVHSVLSQTLNKKEYETIVVKNFLDPDLDDFLAEREIINIYSDKIEIGEKIALGINQANGDIISILDYDDLFLPIKLETVKRVFLEKENLIYYHNNFEIVNEHFYDQKPMIKNLIFPQMYLDTNQLYNLRDKIIKSRLDFNNSCISIKRDLAMKNLNFIKKINISLDSALFYISLTQKDSLLMVDDKILTYYRIHSSNNSLSSGSNNINNNFQGVFLKEKYESNRIKDLNHILEIMEPPLTQTIKQEIIFIKISRCLYNYSLNTVFHISPYEYLLYLKSGNFIKHSIVSIVCFLKQNSKLIDLIYTKILTFFQTPVFLK